MLERASIIWPPMCDWHAILIDSSRALRFFPLRDSNSSIVAGCPRSCLNTVMSMSSENREMSPKALESEVPPLKSNRGPSFGRPLNRASSVQQTQKSFSTFCIAVPRRLAAVRKMSRRSDTLAERTEWNAGFMYSAFWSPPRHSRDPGRRPASMRAEWRGPCANPPGSGGHWLDFSK